ncbi:hypothetical protein [Nocardia yunnanensis]|uniref:hypothetical protein n=1 Tax=Nocardia yunnanensis TaxID=2382165 RepID=UPI0013C4E3AC|nr:hypothetical protein [Nocardia yunnanensis]
MADWPTLLDAVEEIYSAAEYPLSPRPYTMDERGDLVPYELPRDAQGWDELRYADRILASSVYEEQAESVAEQCVDGDPVVHLAQLTHVALPDGGIRSLAHWTDGVETLLPKADLVCLERREFAVTEWYDAEVEDSVIVAWELLDESIGLAAAAGFDPPRYRVGSNHPPAEVLSALRAAEIVTAGSAGELGVYGVAAVEVGAVVVEEVEDEVVGYSE